MGCDASRRGYSPFERLPVELLQRIIGFVKGRSWVTPDRWVLAQPEFFLDRRAEVVNVIKTCRRLHAVGIHILYHDVVFLGTVARLSAPLLFLRTLIEWPAASRGPLPVRRLCCATLLDDEDDDRYGTKASRAGGGGASAWARTWTRIGPTFAREESDAAPEYSPGERALRLFGIDSVGTQPDEETREGRELIQEVFAAILIGLPQLRELQMAKSSRNIRTWWFLQCVFPFTGPPSHRYLDAHLDIAFDHDGAGAGVLPSLESLVFFIDPPDSNIVPLVLDLDATLCRAPRLRRLETSFIPLVGTSWENVVLGCERGGNRLRELCLHGVDCPDAINERDQEPLLALAEIISRLHRLSLTFCAMPVDLLPPGSARRIGAFYPAWMDWEPFIADVLDWCGDELTHLELRATANINCLCKSPPQWSHTPPAGALRAMTALRVLHIDICWLLGDMQTCHQRRIVSALPPALELLIIDEIWHPTHGADDVFDVDVHRTNVAAVLQHLAADCWPAGAVPRLRKVLFRHFAGIDTSKQNVGRLVDMFADKGVELVLVRGSIHELGKELSEAGPEGRV